jgi:uncharacterized protein (TIGR00369 family)
MREAPSDGYFDLESISNGRPMDLLRHLSSGELTPNVARMSSASWEVVEEGTVLARFPTSPWYSAGGPSLYGGAIAWLAEFTMGAAVYSTLEPGEVFATLDMNVRFTRPALINSGDMAIEATVQHQGRRMRIASADVTGSDGKRIAMATSSALVVPGGIKALMQGWIPDEVLQA